MNIQTFFQLTKQMFRAPRAAAQQVSLLSLDEKNVWAYFAAGYVVAQVAFYLLLRIPGHAAFIGEEVFMNGQYDVTALVADALFALVAFFVVYKGLVYFGKHVVLPQYVLLTALMYAMSVGVALVQAPFLLLGHYGVSYVVMFALLLYMLVVWIKAESEMFDLGVWKVFFINAGTMIVLGAVYGIIFETLFT